MFPFLFYPASTDLWWPGHVLLISQFNKYLLSTYMVPEFMYHTEHWIPGTGFGKRQNLNAYMRGEKWKENTASLASYLKNSWNSRSPLIRSERLCTQKTQWQRLNFSIISTPLSQILSPWKLLTELWQKILLLLADKLSPVLYLTHSGAGGVEWGMRCL